MNQLRKGEFRDGSRLEEMSDAQRGVMPLYIQRRVDGQRLWSAFRRSRGNHWTGRDVSAFVAGWDAQS